MSGLIFEQVLKSPDASTQFARRIAMCLQPGDVVLLDGGIGAGKTHFARGVIQSLLHVPEDVPSPTFTLVQTYDTTKGEVWHTDLYRVGGPDEVAELGLLEAFEEAICLVEWPDRLGSERPANALHLAFSVGEHDEERRVVATSAAPTWAERLKGFANG